MLFLLLFLVSVPVLFFVFVWGAPYVPTSGERFKNVLDLAQIKKGDRAIDIGSGDGRLVIAFARAGAEAHGWEINPLLVLKSRRLIKEAKLEDTATIHWGNFWNADLSGFNVVTLYGMSHIMGRLEKKLSQELAAGSRVISAYFTFPNWEIKRKQGDVYLYELSQEDRGAHVVE